jgi:hypothetical protein
MTVLFDWNPQKTLENPPKDGQRVLYYFAPFKIWYIGTYDAEYQTFHGRSGFCDIHDVPWWHPDPPVMPDIDK